MSQYKPKAVSHITDNAEGNLKFLIDNLARINQLGQIIKAKLSTNLRSHCRIINYRDNRVIIAVDSSAWATRLKFEQAQLLSELRNDGFSHLAGIDIVVSNRAQPQ